MTFPVWVAQHFRDGAGLIPRALSQAIENLCKDAYDSGYRQGVIDVEKMRLAEKKGDE